MSKFKLGDKVKVLGNNKYTGLVGFIECIDDRNKSEIIYDIMDINSNTIAKYLSEHLLEKQEITLFESVMIGVNETINHYKELKEQFGTWLYFAPENVTPNEFFREMAEIYPKYNDDHNIKRNRFKVTITQGGEGSVPHVHVYFEHKGSKEDVAYICLGKAEYAPHHMNKTKILNSKEIKGLIEFFNTFRKGASTLDKNGNFIPCNCWQECVDIWLDTYDTDINKYFDIDKNTKKPIMPDYTKLELK